MQPAAWVGGEIVGTGLTSTGIGSFVGVPAMAVSAGIVIGGFGNMAMGLKGFSQVLMSSGSGGGEKSVVGESGKNFARRLMDQKYGSKEYDVGPGSESNKIQK